MPTVFPWWTLGAGIVCALALALLRRVLLDRLDRRDGGHGRRWKMREVAELLIAIGIALLGRLHELYPRALDNDEPVTVGFWGLDDWASNDDARLHPPLPGLIMRLWTRGELDPIGARDVSALAGVGTVALAFALGRRVGGRFGAWIAALLVALSPIALHASQLARGYALLAFGVLLAHTCLTRALESGRERWWLAYSGAVVFASLSEYGAIAPIAADALLAALLTRDRAARIGVATSFGAALAAVSFVVPFAVPTLSQGIGGGVHPPSGIAVALREMGVTVAGGFSHWLAVPVVAACALALRRPRTTELRLAAAIAAIAVSFSIAAEITLVRGRYFAQAWPLIAVLAASAARRASIARAAAVLLLAAHLVGLPAYYAETEVRTDTTAGPRIPLVLARLRQEPNVPVAVAPYYSIGEPIWRLARQLPGPTAGFDCPARFCISTPDRPYLGVELRPGWEHAIFEHHPTFFLVVRHSPPLDPSPSCDHVLTDASTFLFRCSARRD